MAKPPIAPPTEKAGQQPGASRVAPDPRPDELGHEGLESNIKQNTTDQGERKDRGD
jgi:hypothetical protein